MLATKLSFRSTTYLFFFYLFIYYFSLYMYASHDQAVYSRDRPGTGYLYLERIESSAIITKFNTS